MASNTFKYIKLGIFVTSALILLTVGIYNIGNRQNMFGSTITVSAVFDNVKGLKKGNNVRFSGINVGTVADIIILSDTTVKVQMTLEEEVSDFIHQDAIAIIGSDGIVGNMVVSIDHGDRKLPLIQSGDIISSYSRLTSDEMINTLNVTNENAALLTSDLLRITQSILNKNGPINTLLYDTILASDIRKTIASIHATSTNVHRASMSLNQLISQFNNNESILALITADTSAANQLVDVINNLERSSEKMESVLDNIDSLLAATRDENGSLNAILSDSALTADLKQTLHNINEGTKGFNENMEALKHSFPLKKYYKKQQKKADDSLQSKL